jgi:hypothetical protein
LIIEKTSSQLDKSTEYDLDSEDEAFLNDLNSSLSENGKKKGLDEDLLERLIDALEKEYFRQVFYSTLPRKLNLLNSLHPTLLISLKCTETRKRLEF